MFICVCKGVRVSLSDFVPDCCFILSVASVTTSGVFVYMCVKIVAVVYGGLALEENVKSEKQN